MKKVLTILAGLYLFGIISAGFFFLLKGQPTDLNRVLGGPEGLRAFGYDSLGRDLPARSLAGFFMSFTLALLATTVAATVGLTLGGFAGLRGGWIDLTVMRMIDVLEALPNLLLAAVLLLLWQLILPLETAAAQFVGLALAMGLTGWLDLARQMRTLTLRERSMPYLEAAFAIGASGRRRLVKHLWPNIKTSLLLLMLLQIPGYILFEATLSFFGLGLKPPQPSLGQVLLEGWRTMSVSSHVILGPTVLLFLALLSFQFIVRERRARPGTSLRLRGTRAAASLQKPAPGSPPPKA